MKNSQHVFSEAPLPFGLVEEVVEVAAEGDEDKAESEESKNTWHGETAQNKSDERCQTLPTACVQ